MELRVTDLASACRLIRDPAHCGQSACALVMLLHFRQLLRKHYALPG
ncbi:hypothetical protein L810_8399 [Burkholderia sp. AU4i]|nr:hypothetical protein L810_8399 [Burkholderia sp. AU4i]MDW9229429.1 hypothetical protein [Burkholderia cepacia]MDW9248351.1 hypothetical protein [Burkholderia cepacia]